MFDQHTAFDNLIILSGSKTSKSHLFDVGAALTNYVFVKLLEDGNRE